MRIRQLSLRILIVALCVTALAGCNRAVRDGVSIGVTEGLSDGIAELVSAFVTALSGDDQ